MPIFVRASRRAKSYTRSSPRKYSVIRHAKDLRIQLTTQKNLVKKVLGPGYMGMNNAKTASISTTLYMVKQDLHSKVIKGRNISAYHKKF